MDDKDWSRLVDQLKNGACTPLLGAGAMPRDERAAGPGGVIRAGPPSLLDGFDWLVGAARAEGDDARAGPVDPIHRREPAFVRQQVADEVMAVPAPDFEVPTEPHALLAGLPLPVYLTTNYDGFLTQALRRRGKNPRSAICPWNIGAEAVGSRAAEEALLRFPNSREPVVYHLHGSARHPRSMVVTEEDHLEFLLGLAADRGDGRQLIPTQLRPALTTRPLLFLGYDIEDWTFRFLFHGLLRTVAAMEPRRRAVLQLSPPGPADQPDRVAEAQRYLTGYFQRWNIAVFWGDLAEFCAALGARLGWA
ncbi:SIR2 family protein [Frankia sp. CNm7]|uniref:SIR2 family protein n=1 Tax=Frankia nepalensis TaxID=1836974 RepID=A0A937RIF2_9ACTN|nr:SIR2 family protein [Frankia nepalensis]MBL7498136.1 SIR2 family protein [Frankia nepalensis]MBL7509346.1 SIR2 family protein [Frankia nepalensis]MBL7516866.1 SIR2 family protein [Frankia nepalensis]MBL7627924.1 SIR2 family protein [Frankia nepalensis]